MTIQKLNSRTRFNNERLGRCYQRFDSLIDELKNQDLSDNVISTINEHIALINRSIEEKALKKQLRISQHKIIKMLEKEHKIVPKNYYRNLWMILGMTAFGLPMGAAFGASIGNMAFLSIGMPIGMVIGLAVGASKDKEAALQGRQLKFEAKS
ncbi:hypothetical protein AAON49_06780 [Pseudotenacibaculum sp. MALMAid0570]|uniref:hypothetical protein n=1 Tax=Pseudotenacibaculum sp. MALMAid0570 TaxID=3143938 RepID=UPI0032DE6C29